MINKINMEAVSGELYVNRTLKEFPHFENMGDEGGLIIKANSSNIIVNGIDNLKIEEVVYDATNIATEITTLTDTTTTNDELEATSFNGNGIAEYTSTDTVTAVFGLNVDYEFSSISDDTSTADTLVTETPIENGDNLVIVTKQTGNVQTDPSFDDASKWSANGNIEVVGGFAQRLISDGNQHIHSAVPPSAVEGEWFTAKMVVTEISVNSIRLQSYVSDGAPFIDISTPGTYEFTYQISDGNTNAGLTTWFLGDAVGKISDFFIYKRVDTIHELIASGVVESTIIADGSTNTKTDYTPFTGDLIAYYGTNASNSQKILFNPSTYTGGVNNFYAPYYFTGELATPKIINKYKINQSAGGVQKMIGGWNIEGSHDNSNWDTLDSKSPGWHGAAAYNGLWISFVNATAYKYYRVYVTNSNYVRRRNNAGIGFCSMIQADGEPGSMDTTAVTQGEIPSRVYAVDAQPSFAISGGYVDAVTLSDDYSYISNYSFYDDFTNGNINNWSTTGNAVVTFEATRVKVARSGQAYGAGLEINLPLDSGLEYEITFEIETTVGVVDVNWTGGTANHASTGIHTYTFIASGSDTIKFFPSNNVNAVTYINIVDIKCVLPIALFTTRNYETLEDATGSTTVGIKTRFKSIGDKMTRTRFITLKDTP